jgi:hypothetical protein
MGTVGSLSFLELSFLDDPTQFLWLLSREAGISGHATGVLSNF